VTWQFTLTGLLIGVLVGLTGMGGGALLTPILVLLFGFKPTYVGTDILHGALFKTFGAVRHRRLGNVHARLTLWMFLGSGPLSLLGVAVAGWLADAYGDGVQSALGYAIGAALVLGAIGLILKTFVKRGVQPSEAGFVMQRKDKVRAHRIHPRHLALEPLHRAASAGRTAPRARWRARAERDQAAERAGVELRHRRWARHRSRRFRLLALPTIA
jgi:uncharacterized membrane protein YfcA